MMRIGKGYNVGVGVMIMIMLLTEAVYAETLRVPIREEYPRMENLQKIEKISDVLLNGPTYSAIVLDPDAEELAAEFSIFDSQSVLHRHLCLI